MELTVLGSSSKGNSYVLQNNNEALVIEAGVSLKEVKKAIGFNISKIVGVLVSHEHGDHARCVNEFLDSRINVWMSEGTNNAIKSKLKSSYLPLLLESDFKVKIGNFTVLPFDVRHDAVEPYGFLIHHEEIGTMLFATDTYFLPYKFEGLTNILIECNYREDILKRNIESGKIPPSHYNRLLESHMSFTTCKEALLANDLRKVNNIVLIHLSDGNSNAEEFQKDIHLATGKAVHIADRGLKINFNKTPF